MVYKAQGAPRTHHFHRYEGKLDHRKIRTHFLDVLDNHELAQETREVIIDFLNLCTYGEFYLDTPCHYIDRRIDAIYTTLEKTIDAIDARSPDEPSLRGTFPAQVSVEKFMGTFIGHVSPSILKVGPMDPMAMRRSFHGDTVDDLLDKMGDFAREQFELIKSGKCHALGAQGE